MTFEARVLGPVEASMDGRPVSLGSPKQRAVFALLVLQAGRVVPTDRLVDELWGELPPESPLSSLQVYISRLRRSLGANDESSSPGPGSNGNGSSGTGPNGSGSHAIGSSGIGSSGNRSGVRLLRRGPGYQLDVADESVDARRFDRLVATARTRLGHDAHQAQLLLDEALALPRGPALADVVGVLGPLGAAEAKRLDDLRLMARESRLEALLAQGDAATAAAEAAALVREHPLQEELHAVLMLSLYRAGRQAEALAAYEAVRDELAEELGVDPGTALRELHGRILRQDPTLDLPASVVAPRPSHEPPPVVELSPVERQASLPPESPGLATGRVPEPLTSIVGRSADVTSVLDALSRMRLVSLVGIGGAGKSRLALAVVKAARARSPGKVWWVDASMVTDPLTLPRIVAAALGGHELSDRSPLDSAVAQLADTPGLLVLDNCEHLVNACADLSHQLLTSCSGLKVLVTAREPLALPGELVWPVLPLALPPTTTTATLDQVAGYPAIQLWCERASSALAGFQLSSENVGLVTRICRRLDGLPLAIELAAARLRVLSLDEIADALDRHLEVLVGNERGVPDRHRTLQATLDWSFQLLSRQEQEMLAQLSVFQGGFTLEAASSVRESPSPGVSLDLLSRLIDRSLVAVADRGRPTRYRLLETVRLYAAAHLERSSDVTDVNQRHLGYFLGLAEQAEPNLAGPGQRGWLDSLDAEAANLSAALRCSVGEPGSREQALRLVAALWPYWYLRGHYTAGRQWLASALQSSTDLPHGVRAKALAAAGKFAYLQCDYPEASEHLLAARSAYEGLDDGVGVATVLQWLGCVAREQGSYEQSRALHTDSMERWLSAGRPDEVARSYNYLGFVAWLNREWELALELCARAAAFYRRNGDGEGLTWSLIVQGGVSCYTGEAGPAQAALEESRRRSEEAGYREGVAWALNLLGVEAACRNDLRTARQLLRASLREHWELGDRWRAASVLEALASAESLEGQPLSGARLLAAAAHLRLRLGAPTPPVEQADLDATRRRLREALGPDRLAHEMSEGFAEQLEDTVREVLGTDGGRV